MNITPPQRGSGERKSLQAKPCAGDLAMSKTSWLLSLLSPSSRGRSTGEEFWRPEITYVHVPRGSPVPFLGLRVLICMTCLRDPVGDISDAGDNRRCFMNPTSVCV